MLFRSVSQSRYALVVRTVGSENKHEDYVLSVLASVLGGGMSSRLFHEVRERRGLAYYVRATSESYKGVGYLAAYYRECFLLLRLLLL